MKVPVYEPRGLKVRTYALRLLVDQADDTCLMIVDAETGDPIADGVMLWINSKGGVTMGVHVNAKAVAALGLKVNAMGAVEVIP